MELQDIAASILWGTTLESKLQPLEGFVDNKPRAFHDFPRFPGRPSCLQLKDTPRIKFPAPHELHSKDSRGAILHFFANHELLAIELMALGLIKFPDAPSEFRRGIAETITEEQSHLRLYQNRMAELGVGLGDIPVNFYFWNILKAMQQPIDYAVGMGMTFEQANLDYCQYYIKLMENVGDLKTGELLKKVYEDEVGHVKYGVTWFERWRDTGSSQWQSYRQQLRRQPPLNPIRAKGIGFDKRGRQRAGFSQDFIEQLEIHESTKGKDPTAYWYNADCELEVAHGKPGYSPSLGVSTLMQDFECLPMFLANRGDVVFCRRPPSLNYLRRCREQFGHIPEFVPWSGKLDDLPQAISGQRFSRFQPWGWTPRSAAMESILAANGKRFESQRPQEPKSVDLFRKDIIPQMRHAIREAFPDSQSCFGPVGIDGIVARSSEQVFAEVQRIKAQFGLPTVVKSPFGFSGANMCRLYPEKGIQASQSGWITKQLKSFGAVVVEPWLSKVYDISFVWKSSQAPLQRNVFITDNKGRYRGVKLGPTQAKFDSSDLKELFAPERPSLFDLMENIARLVQRYVKGLGFTQAAGVDLFIYRWPFDNRLYLRTLGEINARFTMGHIATVLEKKFSRGRPGYWLILGISDMSALGCSSMKQLATALESKVRQKDDLFFTNDPSQAMGAISFLVFDLDIMAWLREALELGY